jgi:hypothetical protein
MMKKMAAKKIAEANVRQAMLDAANTNNSVTKPSANVGIAMPPPQPNSAQQNIGNRSDAPVVDMADSDTEPEFISQVLDPAARERMRQAWTQQQAQKQARRQTPPPQYGQDPNAWQSPPPPMQVAPPPPPEDPIAVIAKEGFALFKEWMTGQNAAKVAAQQGPNLFQVLGERSFARFMDQMASSAGRATGGKIGKTDPGAMDVDDIAADAGIYAMKQQYEQGLAELRGIKGDLETKASALTDILTKAKKSTEGFVHE